MSTVIFQARDWSDWYVVRKWLEANCPGQYKLVSANDGVPAAFQYPQAHQRGLMNHLYPPPPEPPAATVEAEPVAPARAARKPEPAAPAEPEPPAPEPPAPAEPEPTPAAAPEEAVVDAPSEAPARVGLATGGVVKAPTRASAAAELVPPVAPELKRRPSGTAGKPPAAGGKK